MTHDRTPTDAEFRAWAHSSLGPEIAIERLPGDVSVRTYARLTAPDGTSAILSFCPPSLRDAARRFVQTTKLLESASVRVADILAANIDEGWILLEDLGRKTLFDLDLSESDRMAYYGDAIATLGKLRELDRSTVRTLSPDLDAAALQGELDQTWELFLYPARMSGDRRTTERLDDALRALCVRIGDHDLVPAHRDFMARNLMPCGVGRSAVIDHQDLRLAPRFYDLASLLNDSLFASSAVERELLTEAGAGDGIEEYRRAVLQRTLKAVGTFVAFSRRGNPRYLPLVAPTLARAAEQLPHLPETAAIADPLTERWRSIGPSDLVDFA